jgi:hypothetical protein
MKIYVIGAITQYGEIADPEEFQDIMDKLKYLGFKSICSPLEIMKSDIPYNYKKEQRLEMVDVCDMVLLQRNWRQDPACHEDFAHAAKKGMHIRFNSSADWLDIRRIAGFPCN